MASSEDGKQRLREAVNKVRRTIKQVRDKRRSLGEENTKASMINPILTAMGWDLTDPTEVDHEHVTKAREKVDYALMAAGSPTLFVEAKELGSNLDDNKAALQTVRYAATEGVEWCVLTDGNQYCIYNAHAPVDITQKLFCAVRISDAAHTDNTVETLHLLSKPQMETGTLSRLWQAHFADRAVQTALHDFLKPGTSSLITQIRKRTQGLTPKDIRASLRRLNIEIDVPLLAAIPPVPHEPRKPTRKRKRPKRVAGRASRLQIQIAGRSHACTYANELLTNLAEWLIEQGKLAANNCPVIVTRRGGRGQKRCLVNTEPRHPGGHAFMAAKQLSNGTYIETHASRSDLERYARLLLRWANVDDAVLKVHETSG